MDFSKLVNGKVPSDLKNYLENPFKNIPDLKTSLQLCKKYGVALHPRYLIYWAEFTASEFIVFLEFLKSLKITSSGSMISAEKKRDFEKLGIEHRVSGVMIEIDKENTEVLLVCLGINPFEKYYLDSWVDKLIAEAKKDLSISVCEIVSKHSLWEIRDKAGSYIGARMGRPEKAKMRKQFNDETRSHGLFPVGEQGGRLKNLVEVFNKVGHIEEDFRTFYCAKCERETIYPHCETCGQECRQLFFERYSDVPIDLNFVMGILPKIRGLIKNSGQQMPENVLKSIDDFEKLLRQRFSSEKSFVDAKLIDDGKAVVTSVLGELDKKLMEKEDLKQNIIALRKFNQIVRYKKSKVDMKTYLKNLRDVLGSKVSFPKHVKGITATINKHHTTEHVAKGFLRELNHVFVNKDGTVRYDMIEMGLTHFKPKEIGTSISKLKELGYTHDYLGKELVSSDQVVEIFPQDVVLPDCVESGDELCSDYVVNTGNFVDDMLEKVYGMERFYNFKSKEDTIGHLIIGLAPHTSAGIVGRILGYTKTQGCFSHPVWHAAQRRNLDGDENGIMLLMDGLINFSREFLPDRRGSRTMDVSLVLTSHLYLDQIDDEVHGMDIVPYYPLEFYEAGYKYESPKSVKIEKVEKRIDREVIDEKYLGYQFTHTTTDMNNTVMCSSYKSVPSMAEKLELQLNLGRKIRAVDADTVGTFVIDKHFMKDIKGNLRKFSQQSFRCTKCNTIYRRPPLVGKCTKCGNPSINFTISEGSVKKYVGHSFNIIRDFEVDPYVAECIELVNLRIESVFGKETEQQKNLSSFFK
ncbi:MAG: hypothetical protein ACOCXG_00450 [Nanoarchaeota archaeon]